MCAIAGILGQEAPPEAIAAMLATMARRGPDDRGVFQEEGVTLLHARLAVIDPAGGRQPMTLHFGGAECPSNRWPSFCSSRRSSPVLYSSPL